MDSFVAVCFAPHAMLAAWTVEPEHLYQEQIRPDGQLEAAFLPPQQSDIAAGSSAAALFHSHHEGDDGS